jgi:ribonuclease P protein component
MSLGAAGRLHSSAEYLSLQRRGLRAQSEHFVLYAGKIHADDQASRLGITVSRRIGSAVVRNRLKRRIREIFRSELRATIPPAVSLVVIARSGAGSLAFDSVRNEIVRSTGTIVSRMARR